MSEMWNRAQEQRGSDGNPSITCRYPGCKKVRIHKNCVNQVCASHCRVMSGGCEVAQHQSDAPASTPYQELLPPTSQLPLMLPSVFPQADSNPHILSNPSQFPPPTPAFHLDPNLNPPTMSGTSGFRAPSMQITTEPPSSLDPRPNPRFANQMRPVFTEQMERKQARLENRRIVEETRLEAVSIL
jgi:hypothetical protein